MGCFVVESLLWSYRYRIPVVEHLLCFCCGQFVVEDLLWNLLLWNLSCGMFCCGIFVVESSLLKNVVE